MYIPIILGTAREGRRAEAAARYVLEEIKKQNGVDTEFVDVRDFVTKPVTGAACSADRTAQWMEIAKRADAFVFVFPEYNHGIPGELKLLLDQLYGEYNRKPVGCVTVSIGPVAGARAIEQFRLSAIELQMVPVRNSVMVGNIGSKIENNALVVDEQLTKAVGTMFGELMWYVRALSPARNSV